MTDSLVPDRSKTDLSKSLRPAVETSSEKRKEARGSGNGPVRVKWQNPKDMEVNGRLKDYSPSGFRMRHESRALTAGQLVEFDHFAARGRARVVWTRITGDVVETGFLVVSDQ